MAEPIVIVGMGAAGLSVAQTLRAGGYPDAIRLLSDEMDRLPYDRPPLSKSYLFGKLSHDDILLADHEQLASLAVDVRVGVRATSLSLDNQSVTDEYGRVHRFSELIIATGASPRYLDIEGHSNVHVLRTREDALRLRASLADATSLLVVGGGFLGLEVASTAREFGIHVTVVDPAPEILAGRLGEVAASRLYALHREHGTRLLLGVGPVSEANTGSGPTSVTHDSASSTCSIRLTDGSSVEADAVLVAIGCTATTRWLLESGLAIDDGVVCDEYLRAATGVWAAGDVARRIERDTGRSVRFEHRTNASEQGRAVARNILGARTPFSAVPFFWTDHFGVRVQLVGRVSHEDWRMVNLARPGSFLVEFVADGTLCGVLGWNAAREITPYRRRLSQTFSGQGSA